MVITGPGNEHQCLMQGRGEVVYHRVSSVGLKRIISVGVFKESCFVSTSELSENESNAGITGGK